MTDLPPTPAPVSTLDYSYATNRGRPGVVTAVGVISIVVACLTGLGSLMGMFSALGYIMMSRMPASAFTAGPPTPMTATTSPTGTPGVTLQTYNATSWTVVSGPGATTTASATIPVTTAPAFTANPFGRINPFAAMLSMLAAVLSFGIAIYLLVAGIQVLRDSPSGAKLHRWYVMLKIPLVIFATAVAIWLSTSMMSGMMSSLPPGVGGADAAVRFGFMLAGALIPACIGLAWPIALIFLLRSKSVRSYYNTVRA
jgi:hypothetical protein